MKLHLGSGGIRHDGWVNVDLDAPDADVHLDLREPLPFDDDSVELIINEHFIEHIARDQAVMFLCECRRVLIPNGILRISTPSLRVLVERYMAGDIREWAGIWEPATPCRMVNEGMRLWGHEFLYDADELTAALREAGFEELRFCDWRVSAVPELAGLESRPYHGELIVEAVKPAGGSPDDRRRPSGVRDLLRAAGRRRNRT